MKIKKENIVLVPTDFSEVANYAIDHAAGIAKLLGGKVTLLHVINKDTKAFLKKENLSDDTINDKLKAIASLVANKYSVKLDYIAEEGSIFTTIAKVTNDINAKIIVMGTHGKIGVQHLVGSFALKVIESSPVPVIVVQEKDFGKGYKNILLPVDESPESKQKVNWAIHIAKIFNSTIHIYNVQHSDQFLSDEVDRNVAQIKKFLKESNVQFDVYDCHNSKSNLCKDVMAYADHIKPDLIMIMTNPAQLMPSFIISPWAEHVIFNSSKIPTMCINPVDFGITYIGN